MRGKLLFVVGLATGYVLGTRAGRERYEQIKTGAQKVWNLPPVQSGVQSLQDFTGTRIDKLQSKVVSSAKKAVASALKLDESDYPTKKDKTDAPAANATSPSTAETGD